MSAQSWQQRQDSPKNFNGGKPFSLTRGTVSKNIREILLLSTFLLLGPRGSQTHGRIEKQTVLSFYQKSGRSDLWLGKKYPSENFRTEKYENEEVSPYGLKIRMKMAEERLSEGDWCKCSNLCKNKQKKMIKNFWFWCWHVKCLEIITSISKQEKAGQVENQQLFSDRSEDRLQIYPLSWNLETQANSDTVKICLPGSEQTSEQTLSGIKRGPTKIERQFPRR